MSRRSFVRVFAAAVAAIVLVPSAASAADATVVLTVAGPGPGTHGSGKPAAACPLTMAEGADGLAVLDAAKSSGCIGSYTTVTFAGFGTFLQCIDGVCGGRDPRGAACWYWAMTENGVMTDYGVDGFRAGNGDVLSFTLAPYGAQPAGCV
jgi:hypothetical protein